MVWYALLHVSSLNPEGLLTSDMSEGESIGGISLDIFPEHLMVLVPMCLLVQDWHFAGFLYQEYGGSHENVRSLGEF